MTQYFYTHAINVPPGTLSTAPFIRSKVCQDAILNKMVMRIPAGHVGLTGVAILWSGVTLWPSTPGAYVIGDNESIDWEPNIEITENGLQMAGFNTDRITHSFYAKFWLTSKTPSNPVIIASPQAGARLAANVPATVAQLAGSLTAADVAAVAQLAARGAGAPALDGAL